ncbi:2OG-Fe dioxygenase family protein [Parvibium lacunae]|uniref:2OG-Fe dioxygenase family protein n=1 Tax=Parvibium lacunae TaxID=1888893 RepID=A0A368L7Y3_9BURK|nr:2OG-Fe dioxygenase family protein [Parvibium lacunae]RCS59763.1 hypothetical protein DU000_03400 [Parvibium lacunae]
MPDFLTTDFSFTPPDIDHLRTTLSASGCALGALPSALTTAPQFASLQDTWQRLPQDRYLKDGGSYRARRHDSLIQEVGQTTPTRLQLMPYRPHWQPTTYNALHGGIRRWFEPLEAHLWHPPSLLSALIEWLGHLFEQVRAAQGQEVERWFIEAHQFRIDASTGMGKPTPEGAHRDGVDFVALLLLARDNVEGGLTRIYDQAGQCLQATTLSHPGTLMLLDDTRVVHETSPITPAQSTLPAYRDTLVLTYRAGGFQEPNAG